jgi:hypothetical protein
MLDAEDLGLETDLHGETGRATGAESRNGARVGVDGSVRRTTAHLNVGLETTSLTQVCDETEVDSEVRSDVAETQIIGHAHDLGAAHVAEASNVQRSVHVSRATEADVERGVCTVTDLVIAHDQGVEGCQGQTLGANPQADLGTDLKDHGAVDQPRIRSQGTTEGRLCPDTGLNEEATGAPLLDVVLLRRSGGGEQGEHGDQEDDETHFTFLSSLSGCCGFLDPSAFWRGSSPTEVSRFL